MNTKKNISHECFVLRSPWNLFLKKESPPVQTAREKYPKISFFKNAVKLTAPRGSYAESFHLVILKDVIHRLKS